MQDEYLNWNEILASHFFNENMSGREILLYANSDLIDEVGNRSGGKEGFINAIRTGPSRIRNGDLCVKAYKLFETWRFDRSGDFPPYIAYLISFVLASDVDGDFDANAYYPRLKTLLKFERDSDVHHCFHKMWELWDDLEKWSKEDREGELGNFTARIRGKKMHIGLPLSQTVLSGEERNHLPLLFTDANLEPGANLSSTIILNALKKYGAKYLGKKTLRLIDSNQDEDLRIALVNFVQEELAEWSGVPDAEAETEDDRFETKENGKYVRSAVKLCLRIEPLSKKVTSFLRIKSNSDFPVDGLNLSGTGVFDQELTCKRATKFWTTPLKQENHIDAYSINWSNSLILRDEERKWVAASNGEAIKFLIPGKHEQLPDTWVESSSQTGRNIEFAIVCCPEQLNGVKEWVETGCELLKPETVLPNGWSLFQIKNARTPFPGSGANDFEQVTLRLRGGVRLGNKNSFVNYFPPKVIVENAPANIEIKVSGNDSSTPTKLVKEQGLNIWDFPEELPVGQPLRIRVLENDEEIKVNGTRIITFDDGNKLSPSYDISKPKVARDATGKFIPATGTEAAVISGSKIYNHDLSIQPPVEMFPLLATAGNLILIGQRVGEAQAVEPDDQIQFEPVWALTKKDRKRWQVSFCANNVEKSLPLSAPANTPSRQVKEWKRLIWINRMVNDTSQLEPAAIKELWEAYKNAAARL
jgi:hypothetical protein